MHKHSFIRTMLFVCLFTLGSHFVSAQGLFLQFHSGYSFNLNSVVSGSHLTVSDLATMEPFSSSLGKGFNVSGLVGYMFNKNLGLELGLTYLLGSASTVEEMGYSGSYGSYVSRIWGNSFRAIPSLKIAAGFDKINPYAKIGVVLASGSFYRENTYKTNEVSVERKKFDGGMAYGISSAVGVSWAVSNRFSYFGELNFLQISYAPSKSHVTDYTVGGVDRLSEMTLRDRETVFLRDFMLDPRTHPLDGEPRKDLKQSITYGTVGLNLGLIYFF